MPASPEANSTLFGVGDPANLCSSPEPWRERASEGCLTGRLVGSLVAEDDRGLAGTGCHMTSSIASCIASSVAGSVAGGARS